MDIYHSDATVLNLESRLTNDNPKHCHIDVDQKYFIKDQSMENLLFKNGKVEDENEHLLVDQKDADDHNTKIDQHKKISHLGSIFNSTGIFWIYLLLFILSIIVGFCVSLAFSLTNIVGIDQLKQDTSTVKLNTHQSVNWERNGSAVAGDNTIGNQTNQLYDPFSLFIDDDDQTIYVADTENHRIMECKFGATSGKMMAGTGHYGNETNQLDRPTSIIINKEKSNLIICDMYNKRIVQWSRQNGTNGEIIISNITCYALAIDNNGDIYVSDWEKNEVRRWKINENYRTLVAGGNGWGNHLDQRRFPRFIFVDEDRSVYVSDWYNNRVIKWVEGAKEGIVAAVSQKEWYAPAGFSSPWGLFVDHFGTIYVADHFKNRIIRWYIGATQGNIILGGSERDFGAQANQLCRPKGLALDRHGNLYVADSHNSRIQRFNIIQI